jgi:hypothetical protein
MSCENECRTRNLFVDWRNNIISFLSLQLEPYNFRINPFISAAFELSEGCTGNCWFCSYSALPLKRTYSFHKNRNEWTEIINTIQKYFMMKEFSACCYWATDPFDNFDYELFSTIFLDEIGFLPSFTTYQAMRQENRIKMFLKKSYEINKHVIHRLSVRNIIEYNYVMKNYKYELKTNAELIKMFGDDGLIKTFSGRARNYIIKNNRIIENELNKANISLGDNSNFINSFLNSRTTACVCGILLNMCNKSMKIICPCKPSDKDPLGYKILYENEYKNALDIEKKIVSYFDNYKNKIMESRFQINIGVTWKIEQNKLLIKTLFKKFSIKNEYNIIIINILELVRNNYYYKYERNNILTKFSINENVLLKLEEFLLTKGIIYREFLL